MADQWSIDPSVIAAERAALGSLMLNQKAMGEVSRWLRPEHFVRPAHRQVWEAMRGLHAKGQPVDPISLHSAMRRDGARDPNNTLGPMLHDLQRVENAPNPVQAVYYGQLVVENHVREELRVAGVRLQDLSDKGVGGPDELLQQARGMTVTHFDGLDEQWRDATRRDGDPHQEQHVVSFDATGEPMNPTHRADAHVVGFDATGEPMDRSTMLGETRAAPADEPMIRPEPGWQPERFQDQPLSDDPATREWRTTMSQIERGREFAGQAPVDRYEVRVYDGRTEDTLAGPFRGPDAADEAWSAMTDAEAARERAGHRPQDGTVAIVEVRENGAERELAPVELDVLAERSDRVLASPDARGLVAIDGGGMER